MSNGNTSITYIGDTQFSIDVRRLDGRRSIMINEAQVDVYNLRDISDKIAGIVSDLKDKLIEKVKKDAYEEGRFAGLCENRKKTYDEGCVAGFKIGFDEGYVKGAAKGYYLGLREEGKPHYEFDKSD